MKMLLHFGSCHLLKLPSNFCFLFNLSAEKKCDQIFHFWAPSYYQRAPTQNLQISIRLICSANMNLIREAKEWSYPQQKSDLYFFQIWFFLQRKSSKFNNHFNIQRQFQHFEYDMIRALVKGHFMHLKIDKSQLLTMKKDLLGAAPTGTLGFEHHR